MGGQGGDLFWRTDKVRRGLVEIGLAVGRRDGDGDGSGWTRGILVHVGRPLGRGLEGR